MSSALEQDEVTSVTVTISATDLDVPIVKNLVRTHGAWAGTIGGIPVGAGRTFSGEAYDASHTLLFSAQATGITISGGAPVLVALVLQQASPPPSFSEQVPVIQSLVASTATPATGAAVALAVSAQGPNGPLAYSWTATGGTFSSPTSAATTWTAPDTDGAETITVHVADARLETATLSVTVQVAASNQKGSATVTADLNVWPVVSLVTASPTRIDVGQAALLAAAASDNDGDPLSYAWSAGCAGSFSDPASARPTFTLAAPLPAPGTCTLVVTASDGRGGTGTGSITVEVGPGASPTIAPKVGATFQSATEVEAGDEVVFSVDAVDPQGSPLTFAWSATGGTLGASSSTSGSSSLSWFAPPASGDWTVTATIADALGAESTHSFSVRSITLTVDASTVASWRAAVPGGGGPMALLSDGRPFLIGARQLVDPATGAVSSWPWTCPTGDDTIWCSTPGWIPMVWTNALGQDLILTSFNVFEAFTPEGDFAWNSFGVGCCDYAQSFAYDRARNVAWAVTWYGGVNSIDLDDGSYPAGYASGWLPTGGGNSQQCMLAVGGDHLWEAAQNGAIILVDTQTRAVVSTTPVVDPSRVVAAGAYTFQHPALDTADSVIVTVNTDPGELTKVALDGHVVYSLANGAVTSPVVDAASTVYVGTSSAAGNAVAAVREDGSQAWSTAVTGVPTDVVLADDGNVYALVASGELVALSKASGRIVRRFVNLDSAPSEMRLRDGKMFVRTASSLYSIPVAAHDYDPASPWPARQHDNFLQGGR